MSKQSPFASLGQFIRVMAKALVIVAALNAVLLALDVNPVRGLVRLNTYDLLGRGRPRLAYPSDFQNGQLPLDALLAMHELSQPKEPGEYRVVLLGESGVAGWGVEDGETLAAQLTARGIRVGGSHVVAYNLAYPHPNVARDLLILDAALPYRPDLVVWFLSPAAVNDDPESAGPNRVFFGLHRERLRALAEQYPALFGGWYDAHAAALLPEEPGWYAFSAIREQELLPIWLNAQFYPFIPPDLARSERRIGTEPAPEEARYMDGHPGFRTMPNVTWDVLRAGCFHARSGGSDLLLVNEPMAINSGPHASRTYNALYGRALYDRYRAALAAFTERYGIAYADLWDAVPPERFTDTPLHMDAHGFGLLAEALAARLAAAEEGSDCR